MDHRNERGSEEDTVEGTERGKSDSHLFLVRLQLEETPGSGVQWTGRVQHVLRGESHPFTGHDMLLKCFTRMLPEIRSADPVEKQGGPAEGPGTVVISPNEREEQNAHKDL